MALAALIPALREADDGPDRLRATLPLAGRTLIEQQARQAARIGAGHIVILVERMPAGLTGAIDRLRADGIVVEVARSIADAADRIHPDETLIFVGDGCLAPATIFDRLAAASGPVLVVVPDTPASADCERIDADTRWAGMMRVDGARLHETVAMLGDWDLELTLLRRAVQEGAERIDLATVAPGTTPLIARSTAALVPFERRLIAATATAGAGGWPRRWLFPAIAKVVLGRLVPRVADPAWLTIAGTGAAMAAVPIAAIGWWVPAMILLLLGGPLELIAERVADARIARLRHARMLRRARKIAAGVALLTLGYGLFAERGQWGWPLAAAGTIGMAWLGHRLRQLAAAIELRRWGGWIADADALIWLVGIVGLAAGWGIAIASALAHALVSLAIVERRFTAAMIAQRRVRDV